MSHNFLLVVVEVIALLVNLSSSHGGYDDAAYYLHFPPIPYNQIEFNGPPHIILPPWVQNPVLNTPTRTADNAGGNLNSPNPTISTLKLHYPQNNSTTNRGNTLVRSMVLNNGTVVYYVSGPWGGMKSNNNQQKVPINQNIDNSLGQQLNPQNFINRQQQQQPQGQGSFPNNGQWSNPQWGWGNWGQQFVSDPFAVSQSPNAVVGSASPESMTGSRQQTSTERPATTTTTEKATTTSTESTTTTTARPRSSVSRSRPYNRNRDGPTTRPPPTRDSLARLQRIVTQIREITRKELRA